MSQVINVRGAAKNYVLGTQKFAALDGIDLEVDRGEFVAIAGRSGSGKTTLLNLLAGIDRPSSGTVEVAGADLGQLSEAGLAQWRGTSIGLVFQFFQLLPALTVAENVMLPMDFARTIPAGMRRERAMQLLDRVGVADQASKLPSALSGGQQQRAAIARALANDPPVLLADEPTGNLDSTTSASVLDLFTSLNREGRTIVVVTHERDVRAVASREVTLADGRIVAQSKAAAK